MTDSINVLAKELAKAIPSKSKTSPYDTQAVVKRIDGDIAWVHIPGGVDETPVQLTTNAKKGDIVQVRVSGGRAWLYGNATNPPTDDSKANEVGKNLIRTETEIYETIVHTEKEIYKEIAADRAEVGELIAGKADIDDLTAATARIGSLEAADVTINGKITAAEGRIGTLEADHVSVSDFEAEQANIDALQADHVSTSDLSATNARIGDLEADHVSVTDFQAEQANIDNLQAATADIDTIRANSAKVQNLTAAQLEADHATIGSLDTNYAKIDLANVNNAWIQNGVVKNAAIGDAQISGVSANKLTAGTIDASNITVTNLNADNITAGTLNGQRIGNGSLSLDKLSEAVYTESEVDDKLDDMQKEIDGAIETYTGTVVPTLNNTPASSWNTTALKDKHVGDVYYVVNNASDQNGYCYRFTKSGSTYSWVLIKDSDVTAALQRLTEAEGDISGLQQFESTTSSWISNTDTELNSLKTRTTNVETSLGDKVDTSTFNELSQTVDENSSSITSLTTTVQSKADSSTVTTLSNTVNNVKQTADTNSSKITKLTTTLGTNADGTTKAGDVMHQVSDVTQDLSGFKTTVSNTYATKTALNDKADADDLDALTSRVSTAETTITQQAGQINLKANSSDVYTKTATNNLLADKADADDVYTKDAIDDEFALYTKTADFSVAPGQIQSTITNSVAGKANSADVYTKTQIDQTVNGINTTVSSKVGNDEIISRINQSAESVTIDANRVNIAGAAIFDNYALKSQAVSNVVVEYAKSTNPTTQPTSGWSTNTPTWEEGKYIWQRTAKTINGSTTYTYTCIQGAQGPVGATGATGQSGSSVTVTNIRYAVSTTETQPADSAFTYTSVPTVAEGSWLWTKTLYSDGSKVYTKAKQGQQGPTGATGATGQSGSSVTVSSIKYAVSTTETQPADSAFTYTSVPTVAEGSWLWTLTTFSNGSKVYSKAKQGKQGPTGATGATGATGQSGSNGTTFTPSVNDSGVISWTNDGGKTNPTSKNIMGPTGATGATGATGESGKDAVGLAKSIPYYLATDMDSGVTTSTPGWSKTPQELTAEKKYLWIYYASVYGEGDTEPELIEIYGDVVSFEYDGDPAPLEAAIVELEPTQEGTGDTSPSNVRPIYGVGGVEVDRVGKNLLDVEDAEQGYLDANGNFVSNASFRLTNYITINSGESFTLSYYRGQSASGSGMCFNWFDENKTFIRRDGRIESVVGRCTDTQTAPSNARYLRASLYYSNDSAYASKHQLERGSTATTYEPYQCQTVSQDFDVSLTPTSTDTDPYLFKAVGDIYGDRLEEDIVGATVNWNQLVQNGNFVDSSVWQQLGCSIAVSGNILTLTKTDDGIGTIYQQVNAQKGHKILVAFDVKGDGVYSGWNFTFGGTEQYGIDVNTSWSRITKIIDKTTDSINFNALRKNSGGNGEVVYSRNVVVTDLTVMFGDATVADAIYNMEQATTGSGIALLKASGFFNGYTPYDSGTLKSVTPTAHVTRGVNAWDEEWEIGSIDASTGANISSNLRLRAKNYINCIPNTSYYFKVDLKYNISGWYSVVCYDANKNCVGTVYPNMNTVFTTPSDAYYMRFVIPDGWAGREYTGGICINISDPTINGQYFPYEEHTYDLGNVELRGTISVSNGELVYNGDVRTYDSTQRQYGYIEFDGSSDENWTLSGNTGNNQYIINVPNAKRTNYITNQVLCNRLPEISSEYGYSHNDINGVGLWQTNVVGTGQIRVCLDTSIVNRNVSIFKIWLSNNPLQVMFPLETATTETSTSFTEIQNVSKYGTLEYITTNNVPVGHNTTYYTRDVFGGYIGFVSGQLVVDRGYVNLGDLDWLYTTGNNSRFYANLENNQLVGEYQLGNLMCSEYQNVRLNDVYMHSTDKSICSHYNLHQVWVYDSSYTDATAFKLAVDGVQLVYPLANPITYQLTQQQIQMLKGQNNIWSDEGKIRVRYYDGQTVGEPYITGVYGDQGNDGVSVVNVTSTNSTEDGGTSVVTVTLSDGSTKTFNVKNGSKGSKGDPGNPGASSQWYYGTACTHTSGTATPATGISAAIVGDMYLNNDTYSVYRCTTAGASGVAVWTYAGNLVDGVIDDIVIGGTNMLKGTEKFNATWFRNRSNQLGTDGEITYTKLWKSASTSWTAYTRQNVIFELNTPYTVSLLARKTNTDSVNPKLCIRNDRGAAITWFTPSNGYEISSTEWERYYFTINEVSAATYTDQPEPFTIYCLYGEGGALSADTALQVAMVKLEKGNVATEWSPAPEDALGSSQRIYKRTNSTTAPAAPTSIVTATTDQGVTGYWTLMHMPRVAASNTAYKYLWTCEQQISLGGYFLGTTVVVADNGTTVIDGGDIQTGTVSADRLNVNDIITKGSIVVSGDNISKLNNNSGYQTSNDVDTKVTNGVANKADKADAVSRQQQIYYRSTSSTAPGKNTTWLSTSGTGYGNWSLSIPQLTSGSTKYPYLFTAVQTQTVSQQAAGNTCTCSTVLLDATTTVIDGGTIITGTVNANAVNASSGTFNTANIPNLDAGKITTGSLSADVIKGNVISAINSLTAGQINGARINAGQLTIGQTQVTGLTGDLDGKASTDAAWTVSIEVSSIDYLTPTATLVAKPYYYGTLTTTGITYQWSKNGTNISGATNSTYTTSDLNAAYTCTIS